MRPDALLDAVAERTGWSDYRIARELGVRQQTVSAWRTGVARSVDDGAALGLARILEVDPLRLVARQHATRAKDPTVRRFWLRVAAE